MGVALKTRASLQGQREVGKQKERKREREGEKGALNGVLALWRVKGSFLIHIYTYTYTERKTERERSHMDTICRQI